LLPLLLLLLPLVIKPAGPAGAAAREAVSNSKDIKTHAW
jgi:hypothetical protein